MPCDPAVRIVRLAVRGDRIVCEAELSPRAPLDTTPQVADRIRQAFPGIERHACVNGEGDTFGAVICHTSLAHALEHLVIHLQTAAAANGADGDAALALQHASADAPAPAVPATSAPSTPSAPRATTFVGTTELLDDAGRRARIEVSYADDLVALAAFRDAVSFLNDAVAECFT